MKQKLIFTLILVTMLLSGCSNKDSLYQSGQKEFENGNYENAINYFIEYQNSYDDVKPLKETYCQYADYLLSNNNYIESLYYYKLAFELDNTDIELEDKVSELTNTIYEQGLQFSDSGNDLLAFQYLSYIKNDMDINSDLIPEDPLLGIWSLGKNYIKLTKSSLSYMNTEYDPTMSDFTEDYILILGDWYINNEGNIEIDDHYLTHHNENYVKYIEIVDNDTIYVEGNNKLTGEYKRIKNR